MDFSRAFQVAPEPWSYGTSDFYRELIENSDSILYSRHTDAKVREYVSLLEKKLLKLLGITETHRAAFVSSSAREMFTRITSQFKPQSAAYVNTGYWSKTACEYAYDRQKSKLIGLEQCNKRNVFDWLHFCHLETISGYQYDNLLQVEKRDALLSCDMTGSLFTLDQDYSDCDVIMAASGKQFGFPGMTIVLLSQRAQDRIAVYSGKDNLIQYLDTFPVTPPLFQIVGLNKLCDLVLANGTDYYMEKRNKAASTLYSYFDSSPYYRCEVPPEHRSIHMVVFSVVDDAFVDMNKLEIFKNHLVSPGTYRLSLVWSHCETEIAALCQYLDESIKEKV